jgi:hypothetical protein
LNAKKKARKKPASKGAGSSRKEDRSASLDSAWREQGTEVAAEVSREMIGRGFGQSREGEDE